MSRRKQTKPLRLNEDDPAQNGKNYQFYVISNILFNRCKKNQ